MAQHLWWCALSLTSMVDVGMELLLSKFTLEEKKSRDFWARLDLWGAFPSLHSSLCLENVAPVKLYLFNTPFGKSKILLTAKSLHSTREHNSGWKSLPTETGNTLFFKGQSRHDGIRAECQDWVAATFLGSGERKGGCNINPSCPPILSSRNCHFKGWFFPQSDSKTVHFQQKKNQF